MSMKDSPKKKEKNRWGKDFTDPDFKEAPTICAICGKSEKCSCQETRPTPKPKV